MMLKTSLAETRSASLHEDLKHHHKQQLAAAQNGAFQIRRNRCQGQTGGRTRPFAPRGLQRARNFLIRRHAPIRRQVIDHLRQILAQALEQIFLRHPGVRNALTWSAPRALAKSLGEIVLFGPVPTHDLATSP